MGFFSIFLRFLNAPFLALSRLLRGASLQTVEKSSAGRIAKNAGGEGRFEDEGAAVADASGGATIDAEARTAINTLLARVRTYGLLAT